LPSTNDHHNTASLFPTSPEHHDVSSMDRGLQEILVSILPVVHYPLLPNPCLHRRECPKHTDISTTRQSITTGNEVDPRREKCERRGCEERGRGRLGYGAVTPHFHPESYSCEWRGRHVTRSFCCSAAAAILPLSASDSSKNLHSALNFPARHSLFQISTRRDADPAVATTQIVLRPS
jgi:hypothetical protein